MTRIFSLLTRKSNLLYFLLCLVLWTLTLLISPVTCEDDIIYLNTESGKTAEDCKNKTLNQADRCEGGKEHSFSEIFFTDCSKSLTNYKLDLLPSPFNPKEACLIFTDLDKAELCLDVTAYANYIRTAVGVFLFVLFLDIIGVGFIVFTIVRGCLNPHPPAPHPHPTQAPSQTAAPTPSGPTVVIVHAGAGGVAGTTPRKDEEKGDD